MTVSRDDEFFLRFLLNCVQIAKPLTDASTNLKNCDTFLSDSDLTFHQINSALSQEVELLCFRCLMVNAFCSGLGRNKFLSFPRNSHHLKSGTAPLEASFSQPIQLPATFDICWKSGLTINPCWI